MARNLLKYKETDSVNFVQSSLKSHPLWVILYINMFFSEPSYGEVRPQKVYFNASGKLLKGFHNEKVLP